MEEFLRVEVHKEYAERMEADHHRFNSRLREIEKRQDDLDELVSTVKVLAIREENVENDVKEIKKDVKSMANKPAQRWENLVTEIIKLLVAGVVGFFLAQNGM